ncbi:MAG: hypothetical protein ACYDAC_11275 [Candidatus Dormibacteria bacterium]
MRCRRRQHFPTAIPFLDIWHLEKRLAEGLGDEVARSSSGPRMARALHGDVDALIAAVAEHWATETDDDERRQRLGVVLEHIDENRDGIVSYARRGGTSLQPHREGHGRGHRPPPESKGASWHRPGADRIVHRLVLKDSRAWDRCWAARRPRTPISAALAA